MENATSPAVTLQAVDESVLARLCAPDHNDQERELSLANDRRMADAEGRVSWLFDRPISQENCPSVTVSELPIEVFNRDAFWQALDAHLSLDDCRAPRLEILTDRGDVNIEIPCRDAFDLVRPDLGALHQLVTSGVTVTVRNLDAYSASLGQIAADVETLTAHNCMIDAIICGPGAHFEDDPQAPAARTFIMLDGEITIAETVTSPAVQVSAPAIVKINALTSVDITVAEHAVLVRVPIALATRDSLRRASLARAHFHPLLRADMPADITLPITSYGGSLFDEPGLFAREATLALAADAFASSIAQKRMLLRPRPWHDPMAVLALIGSESLLLRSTLHGGVVVPTAPCASDVYEVLAAGHMLTISNDVVDDLLPLLDGRSFLLHEILQNVAVPSQFSQAIHALCWVDLFEVQAAP